MRQFELIQCEALPAPIGKRAGWLAGWQASGGKAGRATAARRQMERQQQQQRRLRNNRRELELCHSSAALQLGAHRALNWSRMVEHVMVSILLALH